MTQECAPALYAALVEAKREMWAWSRDQWNIEDFNNFAVIQQINAALTLTDGKPRDSARPPPAKRRSPAVLQPSLL